MNFDQLSALIRSGYTEDQIKQIYTIMDPNGYMKQDPKPSPDPVPTTPPNTTPAPAPAPSPAPSPDPVPTAPAAPPPVDGNTGVKAEESETQKMIREMLGIMQKGFVNNLQQNGQKNEPTAEQILASVIAP